MRSSTARAGSGEGWNLSFKALIALSNRKLTDSISDVEPAPMREASASTASSKIMHLPTVLTSPERVWMGPLAK
jgi:hypothetical protein